MWKVEDSGWTCLLYADTGVGEFGVRETITFTRVFVWYFYCCI